MRAFFVPQLQLALMLAALTLEAVAQQQQPSSILDSLSFPVQQPFGSLQLSRAGCCPHAALPILPQAVEESDTVRGHQMAFVIGAQKAATTALYKMLTAHPNITGRRPGQDANMIPGPLKDFFDEKEPHYFNAHPAKVSYHSLRAFYQRFSHARPGQVLLDGTPDYMETAWAACRIKAAVPQAKLIVLLRDPAARTFSHWRHIIKAEYWKTTPDFPRGRPDPFDQEVKREINHLIARNCTFRDAASSKRSWNDCFQCNSLHCGKYMVERELTDNLCDFQGAGYSGVVLHSLYGPQLAWWLSFFPKEQVHIIHAEYFSKSMAEAMAQAYEFLGLSNVQLSEEVKGRAEELINMHKHNANNPELDPDTYAGAMDELYKFFAPLNKQLYVLLDSLGVKNFPPFAKSYKQGQGIS